MRASHIALLTLAASTAAPVFAAPISHLKARSQDGGVGLSARDSRDGRSEADTLPPRDDHTPERLATRQAVREFMDTVASINARESEVKQEARGLSNDAIEVEERDINPIDSRAAPMTTDEIINALLSRREPDSGQDVQARGFMELIELGASVLGNFLRRDVAPENLLARTDLDELVNSITRRNSISEQQMNARGSFEDLLQALSTSSRRDVESEELFARDNFNDLLNSLKAPSRRNFLEDIFEKHSHPSTREPSKQENQARGDYADFVKALLGSREVSRRATIDDLVRLLGTREYDELD